MLVVDLYASSVDDLIEHSLFFRAPFFCLFCQVIDIMGDKTGQSFEVVVKRANNVTRTLTVIPEEANPDM